VYVLMKYSLFLFYFNHIYEEWTYSDCPALAQSTEYRFLKGSKSRFGDWLDLKRGDGFAFKAISSKGVEPAKYTGFVGI